MGAGVNLTATLQGGDTLQRGLREASSIVQTEQGRAMQLGQLLVERDARAGVKQDTRQLMNSISSSEPHLVGGLLTGEVGASARHGLNVEMGRRPNQKWPPRAVIEAWARRHGITEPGAVFLIRRKIGKKGIKAAPFMAPALEKNRQAIYRIFHQAGLRIVTRVAQGGR